MKDPTIAMLERLGAAVHSPSPGPGGLVRLGREARTRRRRTLTYVAAAVLVVGATGGTIVTREIRRDGPVAAVAPGTHVVTDPADVIGAWQVIEVDGAAPPEGAERGLVLEPFRGNEISARWSDGVNGIGGLLSVESNGEVQLHDVTSSDVGCGPPSCERPSGFGVREAAAMGLTSEGDLVFLAEDGTELAVYEPTPCPSSAAPCLSVAAR